MLPSTQHTTTAIILLFLAGSSYSLGFFAIPVEGHANPPGSLNGVWNMSLALSNLFIIPVRMRLGVYLSAGLAASPKSLPLLASKTHRLRIIACIASCGMAMYILAAIAVSQNNRQLIALALVAINTGAALCKCVQMSMSVSLSTPLFLTTRIP